MVMGSEQSELRDNLSLEFRRGALVLAALSSLRQEQYGYSLKKTLAERGLEIDEGTLYPLLRRLEAQGLLRSRWRIEDGRPRRYYRTSPFGEQVQKELTKEWESLATAIARVIR